MNYIILAIIPIIVGAVTLYGIVKGVKVYECFVEGAKDGISICVRIFPYILAMLVAVGVFRASGSLDIFTSFMAPIVKVIGLPKEIVPLIFIKPLSGSGAMGVFTDILKQYGPDTFIGIIASIIMGTTETIFYTLTVYYGAIGVKKIRHTLWAAILADLTAIIMAITLTRIIF
ncbi:MAG: spore maturation protein [Clostridiales bacterium]|uniref:spore maturation protein n=1 Tax=Clostridium sp. N3C TaxID=1776758 RepID=UPI00092E097E|nr:spore maturation protein [Clostridium sp. N3C]NLZ47499.1 spore maturation protein [Clostridiales bacterium]SCN23041.1 Spore maturation protein B [Clostridium sp. N3C]